MRAGVNIALTLACLSWTHMARARAPEPTAAGRANPDRTHSETARPAQPSAARAAPDPPTALPGAIRVVAASAEPADRIGSETGDRVGPADPVRSEINSWPSGPRELRIDLVRFDQKARLGAPFGQVGLRVVTSGRDLLYELDHLEPSPSAWLDVLLGRPAAVTRALPFRAVADRPGVRMRGRRLALPPGRAAALADALADAARDGARHALDPLRHNGSTRIAHRLDGALEGSLSSQASLRIEGDPRSLAVAAFADRPVLWAAALFLLSPKPNPDLVAWDAVFLPGVLERIIDRASFDGAPLVLERYGTWPPATWDPLEARAERPAGSSDRLTRELAPARGWTDRASPDRGSTSGIWPRLLPVAVRASLKPHGPLPELAALVLLLALLARLKPRLGALAVGSASGLGGLAVLSFGYFAGWSDVGLHTLLLLPPSHVLLAGLALSRRAWRALRRSIIVYLYVGGSVAMTGVSLAAVGWLPPFPPELVMTSLVLHGALLVGAARARDLPTGGRAEGWAPRAVTLIEERSPYTRHRRLRLR